MAAALIIMLALSLAACGDDGGSADQPADQPADQANGAGDGQVDACAIVTQETATKIFGNEAVQDERVPVVDANMLGECLWAYDTETSGQLIQFRVWNGDNYYGMPPDAEAFDLGDESYILVNEFTGIDISWVQDGRSIDLSYYCVGPDTPELQTKVQAMKDLAHQVSGEL